MLNIDSFIYLYDRFSFACYMWPIKQNYTIDEQHIQQKKIIYGDKSLKKVRIAISCLQLGQIFISYSNVQPESIFWYKNAPIRISSWTLSVFMYYTFERMYCITWACEYFFFPRVYYAGLVHSPKIHLFTFIST